MTQNDPLRVTKLAMLRGHQNNLSIYSRFAVKIFSLKKI